MVTTLKSRFGPTGAAELVFYGKSGAIFDPLDEQGEHESPGDEEGQDE